MRAKLSAENVVSSEFAEQMLAGKPEVIVWAEQLPGFGLPSSAAPSTSAGTN